MLAIPQAQRSVQHGDAFYEEVLRRGEVIATYEGIVARLDGGWDADPYHDMWRSKWYLPAEPMSPAERALLEGEAPA